MSYTAHKMKTVSGKDTSIIGIGSWGIGGFAHRDMKLTSRLEDDIYIDALTYTLSKGINFTEIALGYGQGAALPLFKRAVDKSPLVREDIFITHSLYPRDLASIEVVKEDIDGFYKIMDTDYADSTLVTHSMIMIFGEDKVYPLLHSLLQSGKTRYVSLSNGSPKGITAFKAEFGDKFIAHEGHLSFEIRALQDKGVFEKCEELGVKNIIWRPLRQNKTAKMKWKLIEELSDKYGKKPNQIVLTWICSLGYNPMALSTTTGHIDENIAATEFKM